MPTLSPNAAIVKMIKNVSLESNKTCQAGFQGRNMLEVPHANC